MNTKHTPGPWAYYADDSHGFGRQIVGETESGDTAFIGRALSLADAALIAAAPELLDACKSLLTAYNEQTTPTAMEWRAIEAAIRKAEGAA